MDLKEEHLLGERLAEHWYYVSKGRALEDFLKGIKVPEVLDIGAGSGFFSRWLLDADICQSAICVDPGYAEPICEEQHNNKKLTFTQSLSHVEQELILMMDVLEHVEDDVALLRQYTQQMPSHGHVLITVPAFQSLWSGHDIFLDHYRRYNKHQLEQTIQDAGLKVLHTEYFFASLLPLVALSRLWNRFRVQSGTLSEKSDLRIYPDLINSSLTLIHDIERKTLFPINRWGGLTIFSLAVPIDQ
ncbi:MAG: class I SAM-dependent methyltransferase [Gammaproteobacteria bacterium]|nr:class I SAM-dependent methyltransferase [Gammaproteobacteria bacterium]